jgi:putative colanic acid biosynthesis acetyltransferase WcaF
MKSRYANAHTGPSFSLGNRVLRSVWNLAWLLLGQTSPRPAHFLRVWLLRVFGASIGSGVHVYPGVKIWAPWNLDLGDGCGIADGVTPYSQGRITVGRRAVVSQGAD